MSVQVISAAVTLLAHVAGEWSDALVQLVDVSPKTVQLRKGFTANCAVILDPAADLAPQGFGGDHGSSQVEKGESGDHLVSLVGLLNDL